VRILLVGQAAFAEQVLVRLEAAGHEIAAAVCPPDRGPKPDPTKAAALARGVPVHQFPSLKTPAAREAFEAARADLGVLAYVTQIVPEPLLALPRLGSICFHPSLLPRYRGGSAINWQIIRGETRTGVTVFWTDAGIDTGPILLQRKAEIGADDTAGSLYYATLFPLGVEAVVAAVAAIDAGTAPRIPQDERAATYDPLCRDEHAAVSWDRPVAEVYDLIRGCDPQPGAFTHIAGRRVRLHDARREDDPRATTAPGTVLDIGAQGLRVAARGGVLRISRVRPDGEHGKVAAADFAARIGLGAGATIG
jgi:methionyl-tRNA formyltransferase